MSAFTAIVRYHPHFQILHFLMFTSFASRLLLPTLLLCGLSLPAQDYKHRYAFAKAYFGLDLNLVPAYGGSAYLGPDDDVLPFEREGFAVPAVNIGATHFWGHADFYVSITTVPTKSKAQEVESKTRLGAFTGLRIYPWKSKIGSVRPYLGYKFSPVRYRQWSLAGTSFQRTAVKGVLDAGLAYQSKNGYFYIGYNQLLNSKVKVPLTRDQFTNTSLPSGFVTLGANWAIETTYNGDRKADAHFNDAFSKNPRFGWFLAIGPSSVFPLQKSEYFSGDRAFLDDLTMSNILPDVAIGFHFLPLDANVALSYRPIVQERSGDRFRQTVRRSSLALETYKYFGDYHGFTPFFGLGIGYDRLRLTETDGETNLPDLRREILSPHIVFGWDIRPARRGDAWLLRTNLRYTPFSEFEHQNRTISLRQLEFNFIQLVLFPGRMRAYKSYHRG